MSGAMPLVLLLLTAIRDALGDATLGRDHLVDGGMVLGLDQGADGTQAAIC